MGIGRRLRIASLVGLLPVAIIIVNLAMRGKDLVGEAWHVPAIMMLYWGVTTFLAFGVISLGAWLAPGAIARWSLLLEGHPDWPRPDEFRTEIDAVTGLPAVNWIEGWQTAPRRCFIHEDVRTGELLFACTDPRPAAWWEPAVRWHGYAVLAAAVAVPIMALLMRAQTYRYGEEMPPLLVFLGVLMLELVVVAIVLGIKGLHRRWMLAIGHGFDEGRTLVAPWAALEGFLLSDEATLYGAARQNRDSGRNNRVLLAVFGLAAPRFEVSNHSWSADTMAELNRVLNLEFIAKRAEHIARYLSHRDGRDGDPHRGAQDEGVPQRLA
ncbi:MAG: hypothetical protein ABL907_09370 [Hyphomicrobium sp.]